MPPRHGDGRILAAGTNEGSVWLWNLADPARPARLGQLLTVRDDFVYSVAFSPDGKILAAGSGGGTVWLWNLADPARPARLGRPLTGPADLSAQWRSARTGRSWPPAATTARSGCGTSLTQPAPPGSACLPLTGPTVSVNSVAFSPHKRILAAGSNDGTVWLWNLADPARPARLGLR